MADGHGGSRTPSNPAPVSGPGKMSKRTDGGPSAQYVSGLPYGEGQAFMDLQSAAPMGGSAAQTPNPMSASASSPVTPMTAIGAPTTMPDQPMTAGNPYGPGPGPEILPRQNNDNRQRLRQALPILLKLADLPDTPPATRNAIRYLRGVL